MIILRNAYVFTFNPNQDFGRYSILIKENRITDMVLIREENDEKENIKVQKWIELYGDRAEIIDCSSTIIMPPIINSCVKSEGSLIHYLLRNRHYESMEGDIYTDFIFNYIYQELQTDEMKTDLENIYNYSFSKNLKSGVTSFNEFSLRNDTNHLNPVINALKKTGQKISLCYPIKQDANSIRDYKYLNPSSYLTNENLLTIYDISNITELKSHNIDRLFLEVAVNKEVTEKFKQIFQKPVIKFLDEYSLIDSNTSLINPLYLSYEEMKIIKDRNANIIICPRDLLYFTHKYFPVDDYISLGIKFTIGTGWLGEDIMKEVRLFRNKYKELNISSAELLKSVTSLPKQSYFNDNTEQYIDVNKPADMIFVSLSDVRFQFFPESYDFEDLCDFFVDNLSSKDISGVMIGGSFKVRDNKPVNSDENEIIRGANETRKRLYKAGKYEQLSERKKRKENIEKLDLRSRDDDEIKMFSDSTQEKENTESKEEFRIKSKIPVFRQKTVHGQKNLFDDNANNPIIQSDEYQQTPMLNLLFTEIPETNNMDAEIQQIKAIDEKIIKRQPLSEKKTEKQKSSQEEGKVELPKNVKLKFGDD
jgi:hypothetical protein